MRVLTRVFVEVLEKICDPGEIKHLKGPCMGLQMPLWEDPVEIPVKSSQRYLREDLENGGMLGFVR